MKDKINNEYFEWLCSIVSDNPKNESISYRKLLMFLHCKEFRYSILRDENRYSDGLSLRYHFVLDQEYDERMVDYIDGPCSVLEMMIALAIKAENIMDDTKYGDRTRQWFWSMINSLGLGHVTDSVFEKTFVDNIVERFLDRQYQPNGKGGLFTIKNINEDLREVEIWYQLCWYLNKFVS